MFSWLEISSCPRGTGILKFAPVVARLKIPPRLCAINFVSAVRAEYAHKSPGPPRRVVGRACRFLHYKTACRNRRAE